MAQLGTDAPRPLTQLVGDIARFSQENWGRSPMLNLLNRDALRGELEGGTDLLDLDDVDTILASAARWPTVRVVQDGRNLPERDYRMKLRLGGRDVTDVIDPVAVARLLSGGATVVLQSLHRTWPAIAEFAERLENDLSHPVQANAYLTPPGASGLAEHHDPHDVIVCQLHGTKHWEIEGLGPVCLAPGDTLYIPAGTRHSARSAHETSSLHLTLGIIRVTYRKVLERLLAGHCDLDLPLPIGYARGEGDLSNAVATMIDAVRRTLDDVDPGALADRERGRRRSRRRPAGHVSSVARLGEIESGSTIRVVDPDASLEDLGDGFVRLRTDTCVLRLPDKTLPALTALLCDSASVGALPGLDPDGRLVLVHRLVSEGVAVIERDPLPASDHAIEPGCQPGDHPPTNRQPTPHEAPNAFRPILRR